MISTVVFYFFAVLLIGFAVMVVTSPNVFHSAIALTAALSVVAGIYALLGADFLASSQLLIYVGGIMIIMLFVIMFSQRPRDALQKQTNAQGAWGFLAAAVVTGTLVLRLADGFLNGPVSGPVAPTTAALGRLLLSDLVVPFEAISLVLLAALVGAVLFSQDRDEGPLT